MIIQYSMQFFVLRFASGMLEPGLRPIYLLLEHSRTIFFFLIGKVAMQISKPWHRHSRLND